MEKTGERAHILILGRAADGAGKNSSSTPALLFLSDTNFSPHLQPWFSLAVLPEVVFCPHGAE